MRRFILATVQSSILQDLVDVPSDMTLQCAQLNSLKYEGLGPIVGERAYRINSRCSGSEDRHQDFISYNLQRDWHRHNILLTTGSPGLSR
jgi:hypothetical protein